MKLNGSMITNCGLSFEKIKLLGMWFGALEGQFQYKLHKMTRIMNDSERITALAGVLRYPN